MSRGPVGSTSGEVIRGYLDEQVKAIIAADSCVRRGDPDSVHDMRIAVRRLQSALSVFRKLFIQPAARDLAERLGALAVELGVVRDGDVLLARLLASVDAQPPELVIGPVRERLQKTLHGESVRGLAALRLTMNEVAYSDLIDDLSKFVATGIRAGGKAVLPPADVLPGLVARQYRRLARRVERSETVTGSERNRALHRVRKSAKRLRYAAEAVTAIFGPAAAAFADEMLQIQATLGEHQDGVVAGAVLRDLGLAAADRPGESAFTFGLLTGVEEGRAELARREFNAFWKRLQVEAIGCSRVPCAALDPEGPPPGPRKM